MTPPRNQKNNLYSIAKRKIGRAALRLDNCRPNAHIADFILIRMLGGFRLRTFETRDLGSLGDIYGFEGHNLGGLGVNRRLIRNFGALPCTMEP